jgi:hypothetical protein
MAHIPTMLGQAGKAVLTSRGYPDPTSSPDEFSALTDVPLFLGYIFSYFLSGILVVQIFIYYFSFRRTDPRYMKYTVFAVFVVEFLSTSFATMIVIWSIIQKGYLAYSILLWGFKAVAILCGIASSMVHAFYCWRIHILGGHWMIIAVVMTLSLVQCLMVSLSAFGVFSASDDDILSSGTDDRKSLFINVLWLGGSAICDIIIASTILVLQGRILKGLEKSHQLTTRVERMMGTAVDTGMITAVGAAIELLFFLTLRETLVHFSLFYILPKLYANCLMATLNARLTVPGRCFRENSVEIDPTVADGFFHRIPAYRQQSRRSSISSIEIQVHETTISNRSSLNSIMDIKGQSLNYPEFPLNAAAKRNSILDIKSLDHGPEQQQTFHSQVLFQAPFEPDTDHGHVFDPMMPPPTPKSVPTTPMKSPAMTLPDIRRHTILSLGIVQALSRENRKSQKSTYAIDTEPKANEFDLDVENVQTHMPIPPMHWARPVSTSSLSNSEATVPVMPVKQTNPANGIATRPASVAFAFTLEPAPETTSSHSDTHAPAHTHLFPFKLEPLRVPEATLQPMAL